MGDQLTTSGYFWQLCGKLPWLYLPSVFTHTYPHTLTLTIITIVFPDQVWAGTVRPTSIENVQSCREVSQRERERVCAVIDPQVFIFLQCLNIFLSTSLMACVDITHADKHVSVSRPQIYSLCEINGSIRMPQHLEDFSATYNETDLQQ